MNEKIFYEEIEDWDRNAVFYRNENLMAYQEKIYRREIYDFYNIGPDDKVLEGGGGVVRVGPNTIVVDFSPKMIEECKKINKGEKCILASVHQLPFSNESFDTVVANGLFHHLKIQEIFDEALSEFYRVLRPGGRLCIFDRANNLFPRLFFAIRQPLRWIYKPKSTCSTRNEAEFLDSDIEKIKQAGFEIKKRKYIINIFSQAMVIFANSLQYIFGFKIAFWWQKLTWPFIYLIEKVFNFKILCAEQVIVMQKNE